MTFARCERARTVIGVSGVTDQELPFSVDYSYKLDGKKIDPGELSDATGKLKVTIKYKNKTSGKVNVSGVDYDVQQPYVFASLVSFDAEHARNVKVDNGQVMDQEGSFIAVGLAKLEAIDKAGMSEEQKKTLEDATTALKVDIVSIQQRTQAANVILGSATAVSGQLSDGLEGVTAGISQISAGYAKLEEATGKVSEASSKLHSGVEAMSSSVENALSKARGSIDEKLDLIAALSDYVDEQGAFCGNAAAMPASTTFIVTAKAD